MGGNLGQEWPTQAFPLCFPLKLLTCRELCQCKRKKGYGDVSKQQATKMSGSTQMA